MEIFLIDFFFLEIEGGRVGEREGKGERETSICSSNYLCFYWLILIFALTRD